MKWKIGIIDSLSLSLSESDDYSSWLCRLTWNGCNRRIWSEMEWTEWWSFNGIYWNEMVIANPNSAFHDVSVYPKKELPFFILFTAGLCSVTALLALLTHSYPEPMGALAKTVRILHAETTFLLSLSLSFLFDQTVAATVCRDGHLDLLMIYAKSPLILFEYLDYSLGLASRYSFIQYSSIIQSVFTHSSSLFTISLA